MINFLIKFLLFTYLLGMNFFSFAAEKNDYRVIYHPRFPSVPIPERIHVDGKVVIDAPIGHLFQSPILKAYINGQGPFYFMFDTGWGTGSIISQRVVQLLNLPWVGEEKFSVQTPHQLVQGNQDLYFINELRIGEIKLEHYAVNASQKSEKDVELFKRYGVGDEAGLDGILGMNAFYGFMMTIDYKNEKITFQKDSLSTKDKKVIPYGSLQSVPNINLKIHFHKLKHKHDVIQNFIVDTGNYSYIHINSCGIPEMHDFTEKEQLISFDYTGNQKADQFVKLFGDLEILPDYAIKNPYVTFSSSNCKMSWMGLLGRKFFEDHLVIIDHDDSLVKINKN